MGSSPTRAPGIGRTYMELHAEVAGSSRGEHKGREERVYVGALLSNTGFSTLEGPLGDDVDAVLEDGS